MSKSFACSFPRPVGSSPSLPYGSISFRVHPAALCSVRTSFYRSQNSALLAPVFVSRLHLARRSRFLRGLESTSEPELTSESEAGSEATEEVESGLESQAEKVGVEKKRALEFGRLELGVAKGVRQLQLRPGIGVGPQSEEVAETSVSTMAGMLDLEKQFSFYGAYHSNSVNIFIHVLFVWPIFFTSLILWAYTPALAPLPLPGGTLPFQEYMILNFSFIQAAVYALYYVALDRKAGSLGAAICLGCWIAANAVAQALPWSLSWKIVLASQVTCWAAQVYGHQKYEGRAPALLDNLPQAFLMAPFFVLLEGLQSFGYEPYPGFHKKVQKNVDESIREFRTSKAKKAA